MVLCLHVTLLLVSFSVSGEFLRVIKKKYFFVKTRLKKKVLYRLLLFFFFFFPLNRILKKRLVTFLLDASTSN